MLKIKTRNNMLKKYIIHSVILGIIIIIPTQTKSVTVFGIGDEAGIVSASIQSQTAALIEAMNINSQAQTQTANANAQADAGRWNAKKISDMQEKMKEYSEKMQSIKAYISVAKNVKADIRMIETLFCSLLEIRALQGMNNSKRPFKSCIRSLDDDLFESRIESQMNALSLILTELINTSGEDKAVKNAQLLEETQKLATDMKATESELQTEIINNDQLEEKKKENEQYIHSKFRTAFVENFNKRYKK